VAVDTNEFGSDIAYYKAFSGSYSQGCVGFAWLTPSPIASRAALKIIVGTSEQISVRTDSSARLIVSRNGTTIATGTTPLNPNTWYYIELKFVISTTSGSVALRLNGADEISLTTGLNTAAAGGSSWNGIAIQRTGAGWPGGGFFDDIYVLDTSQSPNNDFLGPISVLALSPNAAGNYQQWTPNGASNLGSVLQNDGDGSFVMSSTQNQIDTFAMTDLPISSGTVYAVQQHITARNDGGAARTVAPVLRIGSTDYVGPGFTTGSSYQTFTHIREQNPATSSAWTISDVNGLESGYKLTS
jgi:hypothetical protein